MQLTLLRIEPTPKLVGRQVYWLVPHRDFCVLVYCVFTCTHIHGLPQIAPCVKLNRLCVTAPGEREQFIRGGPAGGCATAIDQQAGTLGHPS